MRTALLLLVLVACGDSSAKPDGGVEPDAFDCTCQVAPPSTCLDANTLETSLAPGTCVDGTSCEFAKMTTPCPFGCDNGECQPQQCTPSCPTQACVDDGCGGTCGPCASGTTFPGLTATNLGIADDIIVSPDGLHIATMRQLKPLPANCGFNPRKVGTLDVWTIATNGSVTRRTIGTDVPLYFSTFTESGYLVYLDKKNPCTGPGELWLADADGSHTRLINPAASFGFVAGNTLFYDVPDPNDPDKSTFDGFVYAMKLPNGQPIKLADIRYNSTYVPDPTGNAIWINYSTTANDLRIVRLDGTSTQLDDATNKYTDFPSWSPDGSKLMFALSDGQNILASLHVINRDGTGRMMLDNQCRCNGFDGAVWSHDGVQVAWLERPPTFGLDAVIHSFAGGADRTLTGVVSPMLGGTVFRLTFSNDDLRLYAGVANDQSGDKMMSGVVATSGAMVSLVPSLQSDGNQFEGSWTEHPNGSVIAIRSGDSSTKVITQGGGTQSVAGIPFEQPRLEPVAANPRWILQHGSQTASIFPTAGTSPGADLPNFAWNSDLSSWAFGGRVPFVFGWSGSTALYPSQISGAFGINTKVTQDLMAVSPTASGRIGSLVAHYRLGAHRIYFTTSPENGLFYVPSP